MVYDYFLQSNTHEVVGGSRSNGDDISTAEGRRRVVKVCEGVDVIFLNAHDGFGQVETLYDLFEAYRDKNKHIVVMGSQSSRGQKDFPYRYSIEKKSLEAACEQIQNCHSLLRVTLLGPGWVSTERTDKLTDERKLSSGNFIKVLEFVLNSDNELHMDTVFFRAREDFHPDKMNKAPWS